MIKIEINRISGDYGFEATDSSGHIARMDSNPENGGGDFGIRPMQMLLMGLGGCSGIDIVSILKKQRQELTDFKMVIEAEREKDKEPALWMHATIKFYLKGAVDPGKAQRAVELSMDKYCSVAETLRKAGCSLSWELELN